MPADDAIVIAPPKPAGQPVPHPRRPQPRRRRRLHVLRPGQGQDRHGRVPLRARTGRHRDAQPPGPRRRAGTDGRQRPRLRLPERPLRPLLVRGEHGRPLRADGRRPAADGRSTSWPRRPSPCRARSPPPIWPCGSAWAPISDTSSCPSTRSSMPWPRGHYRGAAGRRRTGHPRRPTHLRRPAAAIWSSTPASGGSSGPGLPLPLGGQRHPQGPGPRRRSATSIALLAQSIDYGLEHRDEALELRPEFRPRTGPAKADRFVGMYVNQWTLDFGPRRPPGRRRAPGRGHAAGVIPKLVVPEFVDGSGSEDYPK